MNSRMPFDTGKFIARVVVPRRVESIRLATTFLIETARSRKVPGANHEMFEAAVREALTNVLQKEEGPAVCELDIPGCYLIVRVLGQVNRNESQSIELELRF